VAKENAEELAERKRFNRVRLLNEELDQLMVDAANRMTSVLSKASFLAVSAGVIVAASTAHTWTSIAITGVLALALASVALICAAVALRPGAHPAIKARRLVDEYLESFSSAGDLENELVQDKAAAIDAIELVIVARARWVSFGFAALILSTVSLAVVFGAETLGR
jgi:hypothetical protein